MPLHQTIFQWSNLKAEYPNFTKAQECGSPENLVIKGTNSDWRRLSQLILAAMVQQGAWDIDRHMASQQPHENANHTINKATS